MKSAVHQRPVTLEDVARRLAQVETNQESTMQMIRLILQELGIRTEISEVAKDMAARHSASPPSGMGSEGG